MKIQRILSLLLVIIMVLGMIACNEGPGRKPSRDDDDDDAVSSTPGESTPEGSNPGDEQNPGESTPEGSNPGESTPDSTSPDNEQNPLEPNSISIALQTFRDMLKAQGESTQIPDSVAVSMYSLKIKSVLNEFIEFEITNEMRISFVKDLKNELKLALLENGVTSASVKSMITELKTLINNSSDYKFTEKDIVTLFENAAQSVASALIESGLSKEDAIAIASTMFNSILSNISPENPQMAYGIIAEMLNGLMAELAKQGINAAQLCSILDYTQTCLLTILEGELTDEQALEIGNSIEILVLNALNSAGITPQMIEKAINDVKDLIRSFIASKIPAKDVNDLFTALRAMVDFAEDTVKTTIGQSSEGKYSVIDIIAAFMVQSESAPEITLPSIDDIDAFKAYLNNYASKLTAPDKESVDLIAKQITESITKICEFRITDEIRVNTVVSVRDALRAALIENGYTTEYVIAFFGELNKDIITITNFRFNAESVKSLMNEVTNVMTDLLLEAGMTYDDAFATAKNTVDTVIKELTNGTEGDPYATIAALFNEFLNELAKEGFNQEEIVPVLDGIKDTLLTILNGELSHNHAFEISKEIEKILFASLEEIDISKEDIDEMTASFRTLLTALLNAEITESNVDEIFLTLDSGIDYLETALKKIIGNITTGSYSLIDIIAAFAVSGGIGTQPQPNV